MSLSMAAPAFRSRGLWSYVARLLRLRWQITWTGFKRAKLRRKIFTLVLVLLALAAFYGSFWLTGIIIRELGAPELVQSGVDLGALVKDIPVVIVSGAFVLILLSSFGLLLQALYLANDMDFLLSAPIPIRAVFMTKLLQAILPNFGLILLLGLPVLYGLGSANGYHWLFYPMVLIVLGSLALAAAGISALLVMAVARVLPARRVAEVLGFLGAILAMLFSQWNNLRGTYNEDVTLQEMAQGTQRLSALNAVWSPLAWGGRGLVDLGEGSWLPAMLFLTLTLVLAGGVFWVALNAAEKLYYSGWASMQVGTRRRRSRVERRLRQHPGAGRSGQDAGVLDAGALAAGARRQDSILTKLLPSQIRAILVKDSLELSRNLRSLSHLVTPLIMGVVFGVMLLRGGGQPPAGRGEAPEAFIEVFRAFLAYGSMAVSLFVGWTLLSRLALMSFSMESHSYWLLKSAPVSSARLLGAKFLVAYLPALGLGWLFLLAIAVLQKASAATILYGMAANALILAGLDAINLGFGVRGADFNWTDPRRLAGGAAGCLAQVLGFLYLLLAVVLFFGPPIAGPLIGISEGVGRWIGLVAGGGLAVLSTLLPLWTVRGRVARLGEDA
jgi:ABC-2 type transport system permease protein